MKTLTLVFIIFCSLFFVKIKAQHSCSFSLSGNISDYDTKEPLALAVVTLMPINKTVLTDTNGNYLLSNICGGSFTLYVHHLACEPISFQLKINANTIRNIVLPHKTNALKELIINDSFFANDAVISDKVSAIQLFESQGQVLANQIEGIVGVSVLKTGPNVSKPIIHGLHGNRILTITNGVRFESQQWGADHAPEIDPFGANEITVIKGAGALRYGSDAIAGAILISPKPMLSKPGIGGELNLGFFSNNRQANWNFMLEGNAKNHPAWSWRIQTSGKKGGNTATPNYYLWNTGLHEINGSATINYRKPKYQISLFTSLFSTKIGIFLGSQTGNLSDLQQAIVLSEPVFNRNQFSYQIERPNQEVIHLLTKLKFERNFNKNLLWSNSLNVQTNRRKEFDLARISDLPELDLTLTTLQLDSWFEKNRNNIKQTFGLQVNTQFNIWEGNRFFVPNYQQFSVATYHLTQIQFERWQLDFGLRYDSRWLITYRNNEFGLSTDNKNWGNLSGNFGANFDLNATSSIAAITGVAWRPPTVNELFVNGLHHGLSSFEIGDPNMRSEVGLKTSLSYKYRNANNKVHIEVVAYNHLLNGFINIIPDTTPTLTIRGAFPTFKYVQTNASINGFDSKWQFKTNYKIDFEGAFALLWAYDVSNSTWLNQMPANNIRQSIQINLPEFKKLKANSLKLQWQFVGKQIRQSSLFADYAPPPRAYSLWHLNWKTKINKVQLLFAINNVFNTSYREYLNRFRYFTDEMGRNFTLNLSYKF